MADKEGTERDAGVHLTTRNMITIEYQHSPRRKGRMSGQHVTRNRLFLDHPPFQKIQFILNPSKGPPVSRLLEMLEEGCSAGV